MPRRSSRLILSFLLVLAVPAAAGAGEADPAPVSFLQDVLPVLTRTGCNSGTCHGTPNGRNGFRLSLRGFDAELDAMTLTRESSGRRVNRVDPGQSLLLLKATAAVPHEGGRRFAADSPEYKLLEQWIAEGAVDDRETAAAVVELEITPAQAILDAPADSQPLRVTARYSDGGVRDVTHLARIRPADETRAEVAADGTVQRLKAGEVTVSAEYMSRFATAQLLFRDETPEFAWPADVQPRNVVDEHVFAKLQQLRIAPGGPVSDAGFLRRVTLDLNGRLPTPEEVRAFLADPSAERREQAIDRLLNSAGFADWWAMKWTDRLGCNQRFVGKIGAIKYHAWIRDAMAVNMPEDEFARRILTAQGPNYSVPAAGFFRRLREPQTTAEEVAQLFMGVRMQCARCHNHPGERWTQDDYYGLAAFFTGLQFKDGPFFVHRYDKEENVSVKPDTQLPHPRGGRPVPPAFPGDGVAEIPPGTDRRVVFADWLTQPDNPFFAAAAVNRIWYHLFGRGLVEPVDDFRSSNPAAHPELLEALAAEFAAGGFDRRALIRTIVSSQVYQLSSQPGPTNADDDQYFSRMPVRLLPAEVLLDAVSSATGVPEKFSGFPEGVAAVGLPDGEFRHPFLEAFGRPARAMACECERDSDTSLTQALHLVGGAMVDSKIRSDSGRIAQLIAADATDDERIEELFLATLSRFPTDEERAICRQLTGRAGDARQALEDMLWMLLNHQEFLFQH